MPNDKQETLVEILQQEQQRQITEALEEYKRTSEENLKNQQNTSLPQQDLFIQQLQALITTIDSLKQLNWQ